MLASPTVELRPQQQQALTPALVAFAGMLALSGPELEQAVAKELDENPALVADEARRATAAASDGRPPGLPSRDAGSAAGAPGEWDAPGQHSWRDILAADLRLELPTGDGALAELVVGCLDERGLLVESPQLVARAMGLDPRRAADALTTLRAIGPAGVGARDARECLLLQLQRRSEDETWRDLAIRIVEDHLDEVARGRTREVASKVGVSVGDVAAALGYLRAVARPFPRLDGLDPQVAAYVQPDVAFVARPGEPGRFGVELLGRNRLAVTVDPEIRAVARAAGDRGLRGMVDRADAFAARLEECWSTLGRVASLIADRQAGYLEHGDDGSARLTRAAVADALGIHESTVSRATAGKFARLPSGRVVPMAAFFDGATGVRAALQRIVASQQAALSDAELGRRLADAGFVVARRTVAKYRARLGIEPGGGTRANRASPTANRASARRATASGATGD